MKLKGSVIKSAFAVIAVVFMALFVELFNLQEIILSFIIFLLASPFVARSRSLAYSGFALSIALIAASAFLYPASSYAINLAILGYYLLVCLLISVYIRIHGH